MQVLQFTDLHLYGNAGGHLRGVEPDATLRRVLEEVAARDEAHDAILVTGDLVQDDPSGYLRFKSLFGNFRCPVLCIPGNHDEPEVMRRSLAAAPYQYCGTKILGGWQFIMLDSCDPGHVGGRLLALELARLDAALAAAPLHALVCLHHHPVPLGSRWLDGIGLAATDEFWRVIDSHPHVRGVLFGHVHQAYDKKRNGVRLLGTPSTCAQFLPHSDRYALDVRPPAYRALDLQADGRIESDLRWIDIAADARSAAAG